MEESTDTDVARIIVGVAPQNHHAVVKGWHEIWQDIQDATACALDRDPAQIQVELHMLPVPEDRGIIIMAPWPHPEDLTHRMEAWFDALTNRFDGLRLMYEVAEDSKLREVMNEPVEIRLLTSNPHWTYGIVHQ